MNRDGRKQGVALVLVLVFLVLISALVIAFFSTVGTELSGAKSYASGANTKQLADSTTQFVIGAVSQATSGGTTVAWASQPGMIRTYDNSGNPKAFYKLYSSGTMVLTTGSGIPYTPSGDLDPQWGSKPALYTDLNAPVVTGTVAHYPILDGHNLKSTYAPSPQASGSIQAESYFSPFSNNSPNQDIEGFWVITDPNSPQGQVLPGNPVLLDSGSVASNPVPMPVEWLYVLQSGSVIAPVAGNNNKQVTVPGASAADPIVGRIAFWTDDESCKVNINTASEGDYWDTPRTCSNFDRQNLAQYQPAQKEFQRYPGHPATTSLSTVFGSILPVQHSIGANIYSQFRPYYDMAPRLNVDQSGNLGSQAGTAKPVTGSGAGMAGSGALSLKSDRLYASIDEFLFQPTGSPRSSSANPPTGSKLTSNVLDEAKFFITADSRAPDVNLFNQPRIGIWPINSVSNNQTVFDKTIAFCGTVNNYPYYFQRQNSFDPANDLPVNGAINGLGRNRMLIQYLDNLTSSPIPGFGGDFVTKYSQPERDQILTEVFDYVRSQNLLDPLLSSTSQFSQVSPYASSYLGFSGYTNQAGIGQVVPIYDSVNGTRGFGRFPTITEAALMFIVTGWNDNTSGSPSSSDPNYTILNGSVPWGYSGTNAAIRYVNGINVPAVIPPKHVRVQAALIFSFFDPSQGFPSDNSCFQVEVQGLDQFQWNGATMNFPPLAKALTNWSIASSTVYGYNQEKWGGILDYRTMTTAMGPGKTPPIFQYYPFFSDSMDLPYDPTSPASPTVNPPGFQFKGGSITVNMRIPTSNKWSPGTLVQTIKLNFPSSAPVFPAPVYATPLTDTATRDSGRFDLRFAAGTYPWSPQSVLIQPQDVVRSARINTDARVIAASQSLDATTTGTSYFQTYTGSETVNQIHSLTTCTGFPLYGAVLAGQFVPGLTYCPGGVINPWPWNSRSLDTFSGVVNCPTQGAYLSGGAKILGDWDNGVAIAADGPYINKADEGDYQFYDPNANKSTVPYYDDWWNQKAISNAGQTFFSPNRLMPSAVMFGSLSTGVKRNLPWQTLEFKPDPSGNHPGVKKPEDHLLLDLFTMPVVEPYPISEPLSTAGRINMNYQIAPFSYIIRNTGMRAVLKSERMTAIPDTDAGIYKNVSGGTTVNFSSNTYRIPINMDETLKSFDSYFSTNNDIFHSASQICDIPLVPTQDANGGTISLPFDYTNFWSTHRLTGDNSRERPYATIYPRLTTKSNTFTVHMRVQALKKANATSADTWVEGSDVVLSEYRGAQTIERYVDPADTNLPDFTTAANQNTALDAYYKFRVVNTKKFSP